MSMESTIEDILETWFGAGKSSLIDHVFQVDDAVSHFNPGDAEIDKEITSEINPRFVLHDSKGFEPSNLSTFNVVSDFLQRKSANSLELKERLHAVWLCIHTPTDGVRVLEAGDEKFLKLADELQVPVVVVFTQYDRLVRKYTGENRLKLAQKDFDGCVESLSSAATRLKIPMPRYIKVSVRKNYTDNISELVKITHETVEERLKGDAWIMWAVAQRASVPLKIDAYYWRTMSGSLHAVGDLLLRRCLVQVHKDIVACWNPRDGETVLNGDEFKHLVLYVVQDLYEKSHPNSPPDIEKISQFVTLCTSVTAVIAPPVAILGLTYFFVSWISNAVLSNTPDVQHVLIAYTVDLILVLEELFKIALQPSLLGKISWKELEEAFEVYHRSTSQRSAHSDVRVLVERQGGSKLELTSIRQRMEELICQYRQTM
ncbi:hypothetical protein B0H17DRAFT_1080203 [Mycena rosella]|uniref:G domain-containing protein n=1 Tax=Mycena rosella TaxID=1033263 RepID=A0AAD7D3H9_MYCRO|nr:hypothetical protein B0H17DRAFT_1080203 [Mycena rosella]